MKTTNHFFKLKQPLQTLCGSLLSYLLSWPHLLQQWDVKYLVNRARPALQRGRSVVLSHLNNSRHLVGDVFMVCVGISFFLHQFFSPKPWDHSWYYTNWFYFMWTLRPWIMGLFGTLAVLYYWPSRNKSVYILFTVLHSLCWLGIIHFSFLVYDFESFHSYPHWSYWVLAGSVGLGFVLASDHLVYVFEHKVKGNHKRAIGIGEMDDSVDAETKIKLLKSVANEYRKLYTNY